MRRSSLNERRRTSSGIALFMVLASLAVLTFLVTEFTYVSQVNQKLAYNHFDQLKAHVLAKSGLKLSLLRLKAFQQVKNYISSLGPAASMVPPVLLNQIWAFPLIFPLPTDVPGMSPMDRDKIKEFQDESRLEGRFMAIIESESHRYNLNMLVDVSRPLGAPSPAPSASASPGPFGAPSPSPSPSPSPTFDAAAARQNFQDFLGGILARKVEADDAFARLYRDYRLNDLVQNIAAWVDPRFDSPSYRRDHPIPPKRAIFYDVTELHMIPGMDESLYELFAPHLTTFQTAGFNVNTITDSVLRGLFPMMTADETGDFFKFRDDPVEDHRFKDVAAFWEWMKLNLSSIRGDTRELQRMQDELRAKHYELTVEDSIFRVTVTAKVNTAERILQAVVSLLPAAGPAPTPGATPSPTPVANTPALPKASGIQIETLRIL